VLTGGFAQTPEKHVPDTTKRAGMGHKRCQTPSVFSARAPISHPCRPPPRLGPGGGERCGLRPILALLFVEREAFVASRLPREAILAELEDLTGAPAGEIAGILDGMADKGLVMNMTYAGTTYYLLIPGSHRL
jgi:hypothetical protein